MRKKSVTWARSFTVATLLVNLLVWPNATVGQAASTTSFSGQATGVAANVLGIKTILADTGPLPESGGAQQTSLLTASVPQLISAEVLHATTVGQGDRSRSEASIASVNLTVGGNTISADLLMARALAVCASGGPSASGSSEIVGLVVNGQTIAVSGQPNQTVMLPGGISSIIINQQKSSRPGDITVDALHVMVPGAADVVVSSAHADITCPPPGQASCSGSDFVTGGGWITTPSGAKGTFAVAGGVKGGAFWGHLEYHDHGAGGLTVHGTGVTAYAMTAGSTSRHIEGTAEVNGKSGFTYTADVADNGEPGKDVDTFTLNVSNGYAATGKLGGGNIQLHQPCK
jgi:hypothetical protein